MSEKYEVKNHAQQQNVGTLYTEILDYWLSHGRTQVKEKHSLRTT